MWQAGYFGLGKEGTYAADVPPTDYIPLFNAAPGEAALGRAVLPWGQGGPEPRGSAFSGILQAEVEAQPHPLGLLLTAVFGPPQTVPLGGGAFQHAWAPCAGRPSYSVEVAYELLAVRAVGALATGLTFSVRPADRIHAAVGFTAREVRPTTLSTASYAPVEAFLWDTVTAQLSGTAETSAVELTVATAAPLRAVGGWSAAGRVGAIRAAGPVGVTCAFGINEPTSAWLSYFRDQRELSFKMTATGPSVGVSSHQLIVNCNRVRVTDAAFPVAVRQIPMLRGTVVAFAGVGTERTVTVALVNSTPGY